MTKPLTSPGRLVAGRYRLVSQIGGGGMGTVWLARDELLGREIAIKQVLSPATVSPKEADQQRQRALREGRIAARLSHPHAISVYDVALEQGQPWLVMEYLPSRSLAAVLMEDGVLRVGLVAQIGAQVADALAATHAAGIVHRDVKPANILIGQGGRIEGLVKITDFGISHASGDVTLTQTGQITGTPAYLSPEVAQGREMTEASDVFSLGATLYACLEGQPPFGMEDNALAMLHRVAGGDITPPQRAGVLARPLMRMLAADPAERPSMAEVRDELARIAAGRDGDTTTVLLARTELGTSPGQPRTRVFDETPAPAAAVAAPLEKPATQTFEEPRPPEVAARARPADAVTDRTAPPPPPAPPAAAPRPDQRGRRRGGIWLAAAVLGVLVVGLVAFLLTRPDGGTGENDASATTSAAPSTSAAETTQESETTQETEPSGGEGTDAEPTQTTEATESEVPAGGSDDPASAAQTFFASVPGDLPAAYERTSPAFQQEFSLDRFSGFWDDFSDVQVSNIRADGDTTALLDITYVRSDGSSETEPHRITFVRGEDGTLLLDEDVIAE